MSTDRLFDFLSVDLATAQYLFSKYDKNINISKIKPVTAGQSTSNYEATSDNGIKYLLKIYPHNNDHSDMETAGYRYAEKLINVPEIYHFDSSKSDFPNTYLIMQFIESVTLKEYMLANGNNICRICKTYEIIGTMLAHLHSREYNEFAILNPDLTISKSLGTLKSIFQLYLSGFAGNHISESTKNHILSFLNENTYLLNQIESKFVFSHGDFNFSNILIDHTEKVWFIDFEYCFSTPVYYDIGKFFRSGSGFDKNIARNDFIRGYNSILSPNTPMPENWFKLSKLTDVQTLLALINREKIPNGWGKEIEEEIERTLHMFDVE